MVSQSLAGFAAVVAVTVAVLLLLLVPPRLRVPGLGLEVLFGMAAGPSGLGWVMTDLPIKALIAVVLVAVLALAGCEDCVEALGDDARWNIGAHDVVLFGVSLLIVAGAYALLAIVMAKMV